MRLTGSLTEHVEEREITMNKPHVFESAGLGKAPFILTGIRENVYRAANGHCQPGGTCDYCSTGIRWEFHIQSADGHRSKVGCDCILKLERMNNKEFIRSAEDARKQIEAKSRLRAKAKKVNMIAEAKEVLNTCEPVRDALAGKNHPVIEGKTMLDYCEWMMRNAGVTGKTGVAKIILDTAKCPV